jgi:putative ABC transport system permease protein
MRHQSNLNQTPHALSAIERQVVLPFGTSVSIAFKSLRVRFGRSLITITSLSLAIAFLSFVNVSTHLANGMLATGEDGLRQALIRSGFDINPEQNRIGNTPKQKWIVVLSLLVCIVGIVNAQLMAVTERFREIGTMKCLGALDRFVLRLFLLEAGMQGILGALVGALIGTIGALFNDLIRFGTASIVSAPWLQILTAIAWATLIGCILSLGGVLYPAFLAARMQPVEAMRTEP